MGLKPGLCVETQQPPVFGKGLKVKTLEDSFGRKFPYLRLSVTDVCNFRCTYCLPNGYQKTGKEQFLTLPEIERLVRAFAKLGTWKIRLTGGEPTLRPDFVDIARLVSNTPGIRKLAFTTNGYKLPEKVQSYYDAGLRAINVSIDSLNPANFHDITGHNRFQEAMDGVHAALDTGFEAVKINAVLLKGQNDNELDSYLEWIKNIPVSIRFIELMQTGDNQAYFKKYHLSSDVIKQKLITQGWQDTERREGAGPAVEYTHPDYKGTIGLIAPYAKDFCKSCNRLRVTARGDLRLCLFGEAGFPLRPLLQDDSQQEELQDSIMKAMQFKRSSHFLQQGDTGITPHLASVGG